MSPSDRFDLSGKVALITGASRGLGRAMALGLAGAGASVIINSRKLEACQGVVDEIVASGGEASAIAANISHWDELDELVQRAVSRHGHLDVLINNAGMSLPYDQVTSVTEAMWDKVVDLNLKGPYRLMALVGTTMAQGSGGSIINVSSTGSIRPGAFMLPYSAAKSGLNALTVGFAHAFGPTVRVNCIMAGPFFTDVSAAWDLDAFEREVTVRHALKRGGQPDEIVGAALYFASDASSFTTGAILRVDGGIP